MAEYIEREAFRQEIERIYQKHFAKSREKFVQDTFKAMFKRINNAPAADVAPVVHGRWLECDWVEYDGHDECIHYPKEGLVCTNCRNAFKKEFANSPRVNFCPNCGAKMDGEQKDGEG